MSYLSPRLFRVAIIGRPNVGKSTLFNFLTRTRKAVVLDQPGVTRDVLTGVCEWWGKTFELLDTGGLTAYDDKFSPLIYRQVIEALGRVDLLLIVFDGRAGLCAEDRDLIRIAKESSKPFFCVINKVDREHEAELVRSEFYELGVDLMHASFERHERTDEVIEKILEHIPLHVEEAELTARVAIVGKPNVGKSSLCNRILGSYRMLVSDVAGTTVDPVEEVFEFGGEKFTIVDTAGLRKQAKRYSGGDGVEILSSFKSFSSIDHADLVMLVVDSQQGPTEQDAKILSYAYEKSKATILVANKTDLAQDKIEKYREWFRQRLAFEFHFAPEIPLIFTSAETGAGIDALLSKASELIKKLDFSIKTSELNDFFFNVIRQAPAPIFGTSTVKLYYITQTEQRPPCFIAFANHPDGVTPAYRKFLINRIQAEWGLEGIPVRVFIMKSGRAENRE